MKHRRSPQWGDGDPCGYTIIKWLGVAVVAGVCLWLGLAQGNAAQRIEPHQGMDRAPENARPMTVVSPGQPVNGATATTEYGGPFGTMKVPSACNTPQANLRYYNDLAPAGTPFLRSGAHGHGGYLRCIYFYVDGPLTGTDHHYGKWLVFTASDGHGLGLLIGPDGVEASYVNCALPGYHFPFPVGNGQPNDCGESWVSGEGVAYVYQDDTAGDLGKPMFPAMLP